MSGYFHVIFIPSLIALLITHREYSSVNDINDIYSKIMSCWWLEAQFCHKLGECFTFVFTLENIGTNVTKCHSFIKHKITWNYLPCLVLHKVKFSWLCARFSAVIIVDFYIDDFIFALFIFMKDGKAVNYNGSKIIGLIHLKYGKRTACMIIFVPWMRYFPEKQGKGQQRVLISTCIGPPKIMCVYSQQMLKCWKKNLGRSV